jgi:hypothetical protein
MKETCWYLAGSRTDKIERKGKLVAAAKTRAEALHVRKSETRQTVPVFQFYFINKMHENGGNIQQIRNFRSRRNKVSIFTIQSLNCQVRFQVHYNTAK